MFTSLPVSALGLLRFDYCLFCCNVVSSINSPFGRYSKPTTTPYSFRLVCAIFNIPQSLWTLKVCLFTSFSTWTPSIWLLSVFAVMWSHRSAVHSEDYAKPTTLLKDRPDHNTGNYMPYSFRLVCGIFNVPQSLWTLKGCETGPSVFSSYPRRLESRTICGCNYKGSTFSSVILRPWVLWVRPESRPPAYETEPPVCGCSF